MARRYYFREASRTQYYRSTQILENQDLTLGAVLRIADSFETFTRLLNGSRFCNLVWAIERMADKGITITYHIKITWPWQGRRRRRKATKRKNGLKWYELRKRWLGRKAA